MNLYAEEGVQMDEDVPRSITIEEYHEHRKVCEELIRQSDAAIKLANNPEFKELIMEGYFTREPQRLGQMMASGRLNVKQFELCSQDLQGIAGFRTYLTGFTQKGQVARQELSDLEEAFEASASGSTEMEG